MRLPELPVKFCLAAVTLNYLSIQGQVSDYLTSTLQCRRVIYPFHMLALHDSALHTSSLSFFRAPLATNWDSPADISLPRTHTNSIICTSSEQTTISVVRKRSEVAGPLSRGPKTRGQKRIPASLFPFLDHSNYSRGSKNEVLITSQA